MNYRYVTGTNPNRYDIVETKTKYVIMQDICLIEAKDLTRKLNFGSGFDGWTPQFFLERVQLFS